MSAISAAAVSFRTLADGSARVTIDFEPQDVVAAFTLLGKPGQPIAVAALREGHAAIPAEKTKVGPLCLEAVRYCSMPEFWEWINSLGGLKAAGESDAAAFVRTMCMVDSRKEIDHGADTADFFVTKVRMPFMAYMKTRERAAA